MRVFFIQKFVLVFLLSLLIFPQCLHAQQLPKPGEEISARQQAILKEEEKKLRPEKKPAVIEGTEEEKPVEEKAPQIKFYVRKIAISGSTVIAEQEIQQLIRVYEEKDLTLNRLREAAGAVTKYYRLKGYVTSKAVVPPQKIEEGKASIRVVEGKVGDILVEGNRFFREKWIVGFISFRKGDVLRYQRLESDINRINSHPDISCAVMLTRSAEPEMSDIIIRVEDHFPVHISYDFDNGGSKVIEKMRHSWGVKHNNLLGFGDVLSNKFFITKSERFYLGALNYQLPLNRRGTKYQFGWSLSKAHYGEDLRFFSVTGRSISFTNLISHPLYESAQFRLTGYGGLDFLDSKTKVRNSNLNHDRLRPIKTGLQFEFEDPMGRTTLSQELNLGFAHFLGAMARRDPESTRKGGGGQFYTLNTSVTRLQKFLYSTLLILRSDFQFSTYPLPSSKQMAIGGANSVRGYPEGDYTADTGLFTSAELRGRFPWIPTDAEVPFLKEKFHNVFQPIAFFDLGLGWTNARQGNVSRSRQLMSLGFGLRMRLAKHVSARTDWAFPLGDDAIQEGDKVRFHFALASEF